MNGPIHVDMGKVKVTIEFAFELLEKEQKFSFKVCISKWAKLSPMEYQIRKEESQGFNIFC